MARHTKTHKVVLIDNDDTIKGSHKMHAGIFCTPVLPGALLIGQKYVLRKRASKSA
jgi:hypothetical protein